jgi:beta-xylosidase
MQKALYLFCLIAFTFAEMRAQDNQMTTQQAKTYYKQVTKQVVSCHDPSVVWEPGSGRYYIFGSHLAQAYTTDLQNWTTFRAPWGAVQEDGTVSTSNVTNAEAFTRNQVTSLNIGGKEVTFGPFDANGWGGAYGGTYSIDGNLWAPDVIYNEKMKKWCMYMSVNGPTYNSVIVLLTSDKIDGTYVYQGPVVFGGFCSSTDSRVSWKKTDLELVIGTQTTLPTRYNTGTKGWSNYWTNVIDPCVFYDADGQLWMSYGSWFGGIWMLKLDSETGLRDYNTTYTSDYDSKGRSLTSDPYFGKKIAGGYGVSGEASYIEKIGNYYYLFLSYGGLESTGGYQMRVFRSEKPDGPYKDGLGRQATYTSWVNNYGSNPDTRGEKILGPYDNWGFMENGELAQGHNSIIAANDGRTYLVYHTRFNDGSEGHLVRVHQVWVNEDGWLCAAPFEYNGELATDSDIASKPAFTDAEIVGNYKLLMHKFGIDHANREVVEPVDVTLTADGKVTGAYSGSWATTAGTSYITITLGGIAYKGVVVDEQMDGKNCHAVAITCCAKKGVCIWAYKMRDDYKLATHINEQKVPVSDRGYVGASIDLMGMSLGIDGVDLAWTSSLPDVISNTGRFNPTGLTEDTPVELTAKLTAGNWYWTEAYNVTARMDSRPEAEWASGMRCFYNFEDETLSNALNTSESAQLLKGGTNDTPSLATDNLHLGIVNTHFGASGNESYVAMPNPLYGSALTDGATLSFWTKRADDNLWDCLVAFYDDSNSARLYLTGNLYLGYNNNNNVWLDVNHPNTETTNAITANAWHLVTLVFSRKATQGVKFYVDGLERRTNTYNGVVGSDSVAVKKDFDYNYILDHMAKCSKFYLGYGSFWGSAEASFDDVAVYDRALSYIEVVGLKTMENRAYDLAQVITGIDDIQTAPRAATNHRIFDMSGREVHGDSSSLAPGLYIIGHRKVVIR